MEKCVEFLKTRKLEEEETGSVDGESYSKEFLRLLDGVDLNQLIDDERGGSQALLFYCIANDFHQAVDILLQRKDLDVNIGHSDPECYDGLVEGSPLTLAVNNCCWDHVERLLKHERIDVNCKWTEMIDSGCGGSWKYISSILQVCTPHTPKSSEHFYFKKILSRKEFDPNFGCQTHPTHWIPSTSLLWKYFSTFWLMKDLLTHPRINPNQGCAGTKGSVCPLQRYFFTKFPNEFVHFAKLLLFHGADKSHLHHYHYPSSEEDRNKYKIDMKEERKGYEHHDPGTFESQMRYIIGKNDLFYDVIENFPIIFSEDTLFSHSNSNSKLFSVSFKRFCIHFAWCIKLKKEKELKKKGLWICEDVAFHILSFYHDVWWIMQEEEEKEKELNMNCGLEKKEFWGPKFQELDKKRAEEEKEMEKVLYSKKTEDKSECIIL